MEFIKKHYEKLILSIVLLGMAGAAALLPLKISQVRDDLTQATRSIDKRNIKPLPDYDMSTNSALLRRVRSPGTNALALAGHNVFNPIKWKKKPDGTPFPEEQFGLNALIITNISPLLLKVEFRGVRDSGNDVRYDFMVERQSATNAAARGPLPRTLSAGAKVDLFTLKEVQGAKDNPTGLVIELTDGKKLATVSKEKPYTEVGGYVADLKHETENKVFLKQRVGQKISFGGSTYNIIAITSSSVTLEDSKTKKRTTISLKGAP